MSFSETDLSIAATELAELTAALVNEGVPDAITNTATGCDRQVRDWTSRYLVPEDTLKRLWNALVMWNLYTLLPGAIPDNRQTAYDAAIKELEGIRDGKFSQYAPAAETPAGDTGGAAWGSDCRI